jgi:RTX calcium-binding nonapeptide repeat (4 copies)
MTRLVKIAILAAILALAASTAALAINCQGGKCHGSSGQNTLYGTNGPNRIYGYGGADTIYGETARMAPTRFTVAPDPISG